MDPDWLAAGNQSMQQDYPEVQIAALLELLAFLQDALPGLAFIAGHEDLDTTRVAASDDENVKVHRKLDPGPLFPWARVMRSVRLQRLRPL